MSQRFGRALIGLLLTLAAATPAAADDAEKGIKIDAGLAGSITGSSLFEAVPEAGADSPGIPTGYSVTGTCSFTTVLTTNNRLQIVYSASTTASGPQVPQLTYVKCSLQNSLATPNTTYCEVAMGGPSAHCTLATAGRWPFSPITPCIEGFAVYGPTPVTVVNLAKTCDSLIA